VIGSAAGVGDLYGYFTELLERRRREPGDDMISTLVRSTLGDEVSARPCSGTPS
jgi:hypothetical protein